MLDRTFLDHLKSATESRWATLRFNPDLLGPQFATGTLWRPGLSPSEIIDYEHALGFPFPPDVKLLLGAMNGTDRMTLSINISLRRYSPGVYSYPGDLPTIRTMIDRAETRRDEITADLATQGFALKPDANLLPIYAHRYVVATPGEDTSPVLSIWTEPIDCIVYGATLREYLEREFLIAK